MAGRLAPVTFLLIDRGVTEAKTFDRYFFFMKWNVRFLRSAPFQIRTHPPALPFAVTPSRSGKICVVTVSVPSQI